jgi:ketose-bisphosphate aldolase
MLPFFEGPYMPSKHPSSNELVRRAWQRRLVVPAFNIPYLPMMQAVVSALRDTRTFGLIMVARLELVKFEVASLEAFVETYAQLEDTNCTRLHMDHVPVIDEDLLRVDAYAELQQAVDLGFDSIMIDGSRLSLEENIAQTHRVVTMAHADGVAVEAELGAVLGHETGPLPPYEELFVSKKGFTDPHDAVRFVDETGVDWLSVAIGSVHGAVSETRKNDEKIRARLSIEQLDRIQRRLDIPLVLHGGTGIEKTCVREAIVHGIAKINIGTAIRQPYERALAANGDGLQAVYEATVDILKNQLEMAGSAGFLHP